MAQVEGEESHAQQVKARDQGALESQNDHLVHVVDTLEGATLGDRLEAGIGHAESVVQEVKHHEGEHRQPTVNHAASGGLRLHVTLESVTLGTGCAVLADEADRRHDVADEAGNECDAHHPQHILVVPKEFRVGVNLRSTGEHLKVSGQMCQDEAEEGEAGKGHQPLFSDGGEPEFGEEIHGDFGGWNSDPGGEKGGAAAQNFSHSMRISYSRQTKKHSDTR